MEDYEALPGRSEVGEKIFSPVVDRLALISLSAIGIVLAPELTSSVEPVLGGNSFTAVVCGLIFVIPLIASSIGKMYVRIRS